MKSHFNAKFAVRNLQKKVNIPKKEHNCLFLISFQSILIDLTNDNYQDSRMIKNIITC